MTSSSRLWDSVRTSVDESEGYGLYILTGSTVVDKDSILHSGTWKIHRMAKRLFNLWFTKLVNKRNDYYNKLTALYC